MTEWRSDVSASLRHRLDRAVSRALAYLARTQRADGAWLPLWFGNQHSRTSSNPVYGTAAVINALRCHVASRPASGPSAVHSVHDMLARACRFLLSIRTPEGAWGGDANTPASIEETALAVAALAPEAERGSGLVSADDLAPAVAWLLNATDGGQRFNPSPIGLYFASLWYSHSLYPVIFTNLALSRASRLFA
jgi:squalene-hopene/tetraprenyl-beta-curcumene cyclase